MLDFDPDAIALERRFRGQRIGGRSVCIRRGVAALIRVLALLHVVLVTTGAMDSSWAVAKSLAMSHSLHQSGGPVATTAT